MDLFEKDSFVAILADDYDEDRGVYVWRRNGNVGTS